jgi:hypothetical protein
VHANQPIKNELPAGAVRMHKLKNAQIRYRATWWSNRTQKYTFTIRAYNKARATTWSMQKPKKVRTTILTGGGVSAEDNK